MGVPDFAEVLRAAMEERGFENQVELARAIGEGFDSSNLSEYLSGKRVPGTSTLNRLARALPGYRERLLEARNLFKYGKAHQQIMARLEKSEARAQALEAELERLRSTPRSGATHDLPDPGTPDARRAALRIAVDDVQRACLELAAALQVDRRSKASTKRTLARSRETTATKEAFQDALGRLEAALAEVTHLRRLERGAGGGELPPGLRERVAALAEALPQVPAAQRELVLAQLDLVAGTARSFAEQAKTSP